MRHLKSFNLFQNSKIDKTTYLFCEGKISEEEFFNYLEDINESLSDFFQKLKEKVLNVIYTLLIKSIEIGWKIFDKVVSFLNWIIDKIVSWREKNPKAWRITIILLVVFILLIVSAASAKAATTGDPIQSEKINAAIGVLRNLSKYSDKDPMIIKQAIAHLVDLRDGVVDIKGFSSEVTNLANSAIQTGQTIIQSSKDAATGDISQYVTGCVDLIEKGKEVLAAELKEGGNLTSIRLMYK